MLSYYITYDQHMTSKLTSVQPDRPRFMPEGTVSFQRLTLSQLGLKQSRLGVDILDHKVHPGYPTQKLSIPLRFHRNRDILGQKSETVKRTSNCFDFGIN